MVVSLNTKAIYKKQKQPFNGGFDIPMGYSNWRRFEFYNVKIQKAIFKFQKKFSHVMFKGKFIRAYFIDTTLKHSSSYLKDNGTYLKVM